MLGLVACAHGSYERSMGQLEIDCRGGSIDACLAWQERGTKDRENSAEEACRRGDDRVCTRVAISLAQSATAADEVKAESLAKVACGRGDGLGCFLAAELKDGRVGKRDRAANQKIAALYAQSCTLDVHEGCDRAESMASVIRVRGKDQPAGGDLVAPGTLKREVTSPGSDEGPDGLPREAISKVIHEGMAKNKACYERYIEASGARRPGEGRVVLHYFIASDGLVGSAAIRGRTGLPAEIGACLLTNARRLRFPKPGGGGLVSVTFPFVFKLENSRR